VTETETLSSFEMCTTPCRRRCHVARTVSLNRAKDRQGRRGSTLCGQYAIDEEWANSPPGRRLVVVVALPPCRTCMRVVRTRTHAP